MRDDLDNRMPGTTRGGFGAGTIAAIVAAVLIIGALFLWAPGSGDRTASNSSPGTTTGQGSTTPRPAPAPAAPSPTTTNPAR
jgi:hypothetical protein